MAHSPKLKIPRGRKQHHHPLTNDLTIQRSPQSLNPQHKKVPSYPTHPQNLSQSPTSAKYDLRPLFKITLLPHKSIWLLCTKIPLHSKHMVQRDMGGHFCDWIHEWEGKVVQGSIIVSINQETLDIGDGLTSKCKDNRKVG